MTAVAVDRLRAVLADGSDVTTPAARWRSLLALALSVAGLGVSTYLTVDHFAKVRLACADSGVVNCQKVTTSAQSHFLGIPVAVLGLAFYMVMTGLNLPRAWRSSDRRIHLARLVLALTGILFVLYLVAAELLIIGNICLWCTSVHVITFLLLVLLLTTVPPMLGWNGPVREPVPAKGGRQDGRRRTGAPSIAGRGPQAQTAKAETPGAVRQRPSGGVGRQRPRRPPRSQQPAAGGGRRTR